MNHQSRICVALVMQMSNLITSILSFNAKFVYRNVTRGAIAFHDCILESNVKLLAFTLKSIGKHR